MPFIGQEPITGAFHKLDAITTSSTNTYDLSLNGGAYSPASANHLMVSLNGVIQSPGDSFTVSGSQITFVPSSGTLSSSDSIDFIMAYGDVLNIGTPSDGSVNTNQLANNAVIDAKVASGISASKLTGALPALDGSALTGISPYPSTIDHFIVSHSGSINVNTLVYPVGSLVSGNNVTIANGNEITPSVAGRYFVTTNVSASITSSGGYTPTTYIYKNTSQQAARSGIRNYNGGSTLDFPNLSFIVDVNGTSDYIAVAFNQNGANSTINAGYTVGFRIDQ